MEKISTTFLVLFFLFSTAFGQNIKLNSLGFLPDATKKASVISETSAFVVKRISDQKVVFEGKFSEPVFQKDVNQNVKIADFSGVTQKGKYVVELPDGSKSVEFEIATTVYNQAFYTSMRGFYLWRCGTAVQGSHNGHQFAHEACHMNDGFEDYQGKPGQKRDGTGGWHDAGDYGKYITNAGITVGMMFMAWDQFQDKLKKIKLDLPETAKGYPDYLKELKWETDWVLKMQYADGSGKVSHKLTAKNFESFCKPEDDKQKRYFTDWSTDAVANFVAMMAQSARYFEPYDKAYAAQCLKAAQLSYQCLRDNKPKRFEQGEFKTGGYQSGDSDDRLWAAAEMWETTGDASFLKDFEEQATQMSFKIDEDWDWGDVSNLGMFQYTISKRKGKNPEVLQSVQQNILEVANKIVQNATTDVYARPLVRYYWGCNGTIARQVLNLQVANRISPNPKYIETSLDAIAHIFGRNYYNRSYVTGVGINPAMNPHDRRSGSDKEVQPWPGYMVGGGHSAMGWYDKEEDYRTNEIAINWQGALVYALAGFVGK